MADQSNLNTPDVETRADMSTGQINDLPDSAFAYIEPGGEKDSEGKTTPRSLRHFPIHDAAHVRNALARASQSPFGDKAMPKIRAAARKFGIEVSDDRSAPSSGEVLERNAAAVLTEDVDFKQRVIDIIAVPYDEETDVMWRGEVWREVFTRSAFDGIEDHAGRVPVRREHTLGETVGRVIKMDPRYDRGLLASVRVAKTLKGDETLQLASEDMLGASVGYYVKRGSDVELNRRSMLRRVKRAFVEHLAMTDVPAYMGAVPVAVREGLSAQPVAGEPLVTPALDDLMSDDILSWANTRLSGK